MKFIIRTLIVYCFLIATHTSVAQQENTLFFMNRIPQSHYMNPSQHPECKWWASGLVIPSWVLPMIDPPFAHLPVHIDVSTPIDFNDVFIYQNGKPTKTALYDQKTQDKFLKKLRKYNYISTHLSVEALFIGFKQKKNYWTVSLNTHLSSHFSFAKGIFEFPLKGNVNSDGSLRDIDFSGMGINIRAYHELGIGFNRQVDKYLRIGVRPKILFGIADISTPKAHLKLKTTNHQNGRAYPYDMTLEGNYLINTSFPIDFGSDDNITFNDFGIKSEEELIRSTYNTKNMGLGVDLGFMKDWDSELTLYGSVVDLGFINWKSNVNNFQAKIVDSLSFKGVEINNPEKISFEGDDILDSIINMVKFSHTQKAYSTSLATKIYFGGNYKFTKTFAIGLLGKLQKYPYNYEFSSTASANFKPGKWGTATISYSYYKRNFTNIGLGYALKLGIFQWYAVYDNLIGALLFPHNTRYISARWGVNVLVGNPNKKKPAKNMPLLWTL